MAKKHRNPTAAGIAEVAAESRRAFDQFMALPDAEKTRMAERLSAESARARPLTAAEGAFWRGVKKKLGRPRKGSGAKPVNVTIERGLLSRADTYAGRRGLSRSQLVARGLELAIKERG